MEHVPHARSEAKCSAHNIINPHEISGDCTVLVLGRGVRTLGLSPPESRLKHVPSHPWVSVFCRDLISLD